MCGVGWLLLDGSSIGRRNLDIGHEFIEYSMQWVVRFECNFFFHFGDAMRVEVRDLSGLVGVMDCRL